MKIKKLLAVAFCLMLAICFCGIMAACDGGGATYKVTIKDYNTSEGTVTLEPNKDTFKAGEKVKVTVKPATGKEVAKILVGSSDFTDQYYGNFKDNSGYIEVNVNSDKEISVTFQEEGTRLDKDAIWKINVECSKTQGTYTLSPEQEKYTNNQSVKFTVTPIGNNSVKQLFVNDKDVTAQFINNTYTLTMTNHMNVKVVFYDDLSQVYEVRDDFATVDDFFDYAGDGLILVDFTADRCDYCKIIAPYLHSVAQDEGDNLGVKIISLWCGDLYSPTNNAAMQSAYILNSQGKKSFPTLVLFKEKRVIDIFYGAIGYDKNNCYQALIDFISQGIDD